MKDILINAAILFSLFVLWDRYIAGIERDRILCDGGEEKPPQELE